MEKRGPGRIATRGPARMVKKGQGSIEMIVIFGAMLLVMLIIFVALPDQVASVQTVQNQQTATDTVNLVAQTADSVYLAGEGAQQTIWVELPDGTDTGRSFIGAQTGITAWSARKTVDIYTLTTGDVFALSRAPVCGNWPSVPGRYQVVVAYNDTPPAHVMVNGSC